MCVLCCFSAVTFTSFSVSVGVRKLERIVNSLVEIVKITHSTVIITVTVTTLTTTGTPATTRTPDSSGASNPLILLQLCRLRMEWFLHEPVLLTSSTSLLLRVHLWPVLDE